MAIMIEFTLNSVIHRAEPKTNKSPHKQQQQPPKMQRNDRKINK